MSKILKNLSQEQTQEELENIMIVYSKKYTKLVKVKKNKYKTVFKIDGVVKEHEIIEKYLCSLENIEQNEK